MASNRAGGHAAVSHDSISGLAHDWSKIGDPDLAPRPPFKVYLPRDTADVVRAVDETRRLGQRLTLRAAAIRATTWCSPTAATCCICRT